MAESVISPAEIVASPPRSEPHSMTIADLVMMIAGFAVTLRFALDTGDPNRQSMGNWQGSDLGIFLLFLLFTGSIVSASLIALERQIVYRRPARPAEWIVHVLTVTLAWNTFPYWLNADWLANTVLDRLPWETSYSRPLILGMSAILLASGLGGLYVLRMKLPEALKTLWLAGLLIIWLMAVPAFGQFVNSFGPATPTEDTAASSRLPLWIAYFSYCFVVTLPMFLPYAVPGVWALVSRRKRARRWVWSEWFCLVIGILAGLAALGLFYFMLFQPIFDNVTEENIALRFLTPFWILGVAIVSWGLIRIWGRLAKNRPSTQA